MRPIGNLIPEPSVLSQKPSGTTTLPSKPSVQISQQTGAPGSQTTSVSTAQDLGRALTLADPMATDRALQASLPPSVKTSVREIWVDKGTLETGWDGELATIELTHPIPPRDLSTAIHTVESTLKPMPNAEIQKGLARLRLLTKVKQESTEDIRLSLAIYAEEMAPYPADVVRHILKTQPSMSMWWPAWAELKDRLELHTRKRRKLLEAMTTASSQNSSSGRHDLTILSAG